MCDERDNKHSFIDQSFRKLKLAELLILAPPFFFLLRIQNYFRFIKEVKTSISSAIFSSRYIIFWVSLEAYVTCN